MARTAGVYKRGDVYWIRYSVGGLQRRESAKTTRKEEATALLAKRQTDIRDNRFFPERLKTELTLVGLRDMWVEAAAHKKSIAHDQGRFENILAHLGRTKLVSTLTAEDIDGMKRALSAAPTRYSPKGRQPATINRHLALLRAALRLARARGYFHRDPIAGVRFPPEHNKRDRICSPAEYKRLHDAATGELRLAIVCAYYTAMRLGEIAGLQWTQVNLREGSLALAQSQTKESASKKVPLAKPVVEAFREFPRSIDGRVFSVPSAALSSAFGRLTTKLKIHALRFHDLRHTALTNLRRAGVDIITMRSLSGHRTIKMLERYNNVDFDDRMGAVEKMDAYLQKREESSGEDRDGSFGHAETKDSI